MTEANRPHFAALVTGVYAFYRQDCSEFAIGVWWEACKHYDLAAVQDALNRHCVNPDTGQFMPKPADIVRMLEGSSVDGAMVAWSKVDAAIRTVGSYQTVVFDDALIHRVAHEMGGWLKLCQTTDKDLPFVAKEFQTRYRGYRARNELPEYPPSLTGLVEAENRLGGFASSIPAPILVGDAGRAERVFFGGVDKPLLGISRAGDAVQKALAAPGKGAA